VSPIQLLREGILKGDWQAVCDGFEGMSGMRLEPPPASPVVDYDRLGEYLAAQVRGAVRGWVDASGRAGGNFSPSEVADVATEPASTLTAEDADFGPPRTAPEPPQEDAPSVRARELRDRVKAPPAEPEDEFAQFRVQPKEPQPQEDAGDGRRASRALPLAGQKMVNQFVDDGTLAANDAEFDRKVSAKLKPQPRRPAPGTVEVTCYKCGTVEDVPPVFAPVKNAKDDTTSYVCNRCVRAH
jgi:hypothetical protein